MWADLPDRSPHVSFTVPHCAVTKGKGLDALLWITQLHPAALNRNSSGDLEELLALFHKIIISGQILDKHLSYFYKILLDKDRIVDAEHLAFTCQ